MPELCLGHLDLGWALALGSLVMGSFSGVYLRERTCRALLLEREPKAALLTWPAIGLEGEISKEQLGPTTN